MNKKEKVSVGLPDNLREIIIEIPEDEPKPWDGKSELNYIGKRVKRIDGIDKTTGKAKYTFDVKIPGMLYAKFLRSDFPSGTISEIDLSKAQKLKGVYSVLPAQDDLPLIIRYAGQEIAAVAAETAEIAETALQQITFKHTTSDFVLSVEDAIRENAPLVYQTTVKEKTTEGDLDSSESSVVQEGNIRGPKIFPEDENAEKFDDYLRNCEVIHTAEYRTQVQTHSAMETHGVVVEWGSDDKVKVWASTQGTFSVRNDIADYFKLKYNDVRVITEFMGGGFGAKFGAGLYGIMAAKLSRATGKPVRLMLDRKGEHLSVGNRPDSLQKLSIGATKEGKIKALKLISLGTGGVGTGAGTSGPIKNIYDYEKIYVEESDVFINAGPAAAFRAPGHPQGAFALEQTIDEMAHKLGIDPLEFRRINTTGNYIRQAQYVLGAEKFGWDKRNQVPGSIKGPIKRGFGVANSVWYYIYNKGFVATVTINRRGEVQVINGVQDIGGGIGTVLAMIVAEELGLEPDQITVKIGDTDNGFGPASGGSQTTAGITPAVRNAAYKAKIRMIELAASILGITTDKVTMEGSRFSDGDDISKSLSFQQVAAKIPGDEIRVTAERRSDNLGREEIKTTIDGVQFADVTVDTGTGVVKVNRIVAVHDCGRPMDRLTLESQINGGIIQGISYALYENRILDRNTGIMVNPNLEMYKIAGARDVPQIETIIMDFNQAMNSTGAMGIGEPATIPTSAAIANAVFNAIGVRLRSLPITPDKILAALEEQSK